MDRMKVVQIARTYLGVKEGTRKHKQIIDIYNTVKPDGYTAKYTDPWCSEFVTACFISAYGKEKASEIMALSASCSRMVTKAKKMGIWVEKDSYHPKAGDVILYDWQDSGKGDNKSNPDHVGLVSAQSNKGFIVIEGNKSNAVGLRELKFDAKYIRGFIKPKFDVEAYDHDLIMKLADEVIAGKHGNGAARKKSLGKYYDEVQREVNRRLKK